MSQTAEMVRAYVLAKVNPVFEPLMIDLLLKRPNDVISFVIKWMQDKIDSKQEQKNIHTQSQKQVHNQSQKPNLKPPFKQDSQSTLKSKIPSSKTHSSSDDDNDDDDVDDLIITNQQIKRLAAPRVSVSAESYGTFNKKENFKPRDIPKDFQQKERIVNRIMQSFMFQALDIKERDIVVNAMDVKEFEVGDWVIKQGEDGDNLYVVDQGQLDCFKVLVKGDKPTHLKVYQPGESFGELSLLYNAPRAASIKSKTKTTLFALDRETFNNIVKDSAMKKREQYESVLSKVEILKSLERYELTQICDCVQQLKFQSGDYIIKQGETGDRFYMIVNGSLIATKSINPGDEPKKVFDYKAGDYFGELALINKLPRQANIIAESDGEVVFLDQQTFKRILGPIEDILARNSERYELYFKKNI